jgi:hypothetical protein
MRKPKEDRNPKSEWAMRRPVSGLVLGLDAGKQEG